jgi:uncharacterized membrane protein YesL
MDKFFDAENPVMRFLSRLVDLVIVNVITILFSLPIITLGGALTAMNYVLLHLVRGEESYLIPMFRKSFKENFRQGIPLGLIVLATAVITVVDLWVLHGSQSRLATLLMIVITIIAMFLTVTFVYMFALQSRYENTVIGTIINAFRLSVGNLPRTAGMLAVWLLWILVMILFRRAIHILIVLFGLSLPGYLCAMIYDGVFEKLETEGE